MKTWIKVAAFIVFLAVLYLYFTHIDPQFGGFS